MTFRYLKVPYEEFIKKVQEASIPEVNEKSIDWALQVAEIVAIKGHAQHSTEHLDEERVKFEQDANLPVKQLGELYAESQRGKLPSLPTPG